MNAVQILDGAVGTLLEQMGYPSHPILWTAEAARTHPAMLEAIHLAYLEAGVDVITAHTFRTTAYAYRMAGRTEQEAYQALEAAVSLAKGCISRFGKWTALAGSVAPVEDCYRPDLVPGPEELRHSHRLQIGWLKSAGVDLILAETINTVIEAEIIIECSKELDIPVWISLLPGPDSSLHDKVSLSGAINRLWDLGASRVMLNCRPAAEMNDWASVFAHSTHPWGIYANGPGRPDPECGWTREDDNGIDEFIKSAQTWVSMGASVVGGCCGSTPQMIRILRKKLDLSNTQGES